MDIILSINTSYVYPARVLIASIRVNNPNQEIHVYILYNDLKPEGRWGLEETANKFEISLVFLYVDEKLFLDAPLKAMTNPYITVETYFRMALADLLPTSVHKVLYLDTDMVVNGSLAELWGIALKGHISAVCEDMGLRMNKKIRERVYRNLKFDDSHKYFNAGMLLIDMDVFRNSYSLDDYIRFITANHDRLLFHDQDVLNSMWGKNVLYLDYNVYNSRPFYYAFSSKSRKMLNKATIIHYGEKPWLDNFTDMCGNIFFKYASYIDNGEQMDEIAIRQAKYRKQNHFRIFLAHLKRNIKFIILEW